MDIFMQHGSEILFNFYYVFYICIYSDWEIRFAGQGVHSQLHYMGIGVRWVHKVLKTEKKSTFTNLRWTCFIRYCLQSCMPKTTVENFKHCQSTSNVSGRLLVNAMGITSCCSDASREILYTFRSCCTMCSLNIVCANENVYSKTNENIMPYWKQQQEKSIYQSKELLLLQKSLLYYNHGASYYTFVNIMSGNK